MYNLSVEEISMVDGGGDGNSSNLISGMVSIGIGYALSRLHPVLGVAYAIGNIQSTYSNSGVGTGTNQSYGGNGLDTGGGMMQAGGSRGGYGR